MIKLSGYFCILLGLFALCYGNDEVNCDLTEIWGPGLDPVHVIMPARYFFLKAFSDHNTSAESAEKNIFDVKVTDSSESGCRTWVNILDRKDGSFIVRYKVYEACLNLTISVKCNGKHISRSPLRFEGVTYSDGCSCNVNNDIIDWLDKYGCTKRFTQIVSDLEPFEQIDFDILYPIAEEKLFRNYHSLSICDYVIKNNEIHRQCHGQHTGFKMFMDATLLFITRKVRLPDMELLVNLGDWPLIKKDGGAVADILPVFSWCGSEKSHDIVLPTYDITESSLENMGRVTLDTLSVQGNIEKKWNEKIEKLFWRGRDSSRERLSLILLSRRNSDLINASLTDFFFFRDMEHKYGPKEGRISFFKFFDHKYQMNMDGTVAAYRFPYLLASDSLVFKQDSNYYEYFYKQIKRWKHFVPVKKDLSDLVEKIKWAKANDEDARKIALEGQHFARNNLLPHDVFCYHVQLLYDYSTKLVAKNIKIRPGMELVKQNTPKGCDCNHFQTNAVLRRDHEEL